MMMGPAWGPTPNSARALGFAPPSPMAPQGYHVPHSPVYTPRFQNKQVVGPAHGQPTVAIPPSPRDVWLDELDVMDEEALAIGLSLSQAQTDGVDPQSVPGPPLSPSTPRMDEAEIMALDYHAKTEQYFDHRKECSWKLRKNNRWSRPNDSLIFMANQAMFDPSIEGSLAKQDGDGDQKNKEETDGDDDDDDGDDDGDGVDEEDPEAIAEAELEAEMNAKWEERKKAAALAQEMARARGQYTITGRTMAPGAFQTQFVNLAKKTLASGSHFRADLIDVKPGNVNPTLVQKFVKTAASMKVLPSIVMHGTRGDNFNSIFQRGLIVPGKGGVTVVNGAAYGTGIYTSTSAATPVAYARGTAREGDIAKVIVCGVIDPQVPTSKIVAPLVTSSSGPLPTRPTAAPAGPAKTQAPVSTSKTQPTVRGHLVRKEARRAKAQAQANLGRGVQRKAHVAAVQGVPLGFGTSSAVAGGTSLAEKPQSRADVPIKRVGDYRIIRNEQYVVPLGVASFRVQSYGYSRRAPAPYLNPEAYQASLDAAIRTINDPSSSNQNPPPPPTLYGAQQAVHYVRNDLRRRNDTHIRRSRRTTRMPSAHLPYT